MSPKTDGGQHRPLDLALNRRGFLVWCTGSALALAGCGGGSGSGASGGPGGGGGGGGDAAGRVAAVGAVEDQLRQLSTQNLSPADTLQAIATFMAGRPEYQAAGVDQESVTAWGLFKDGTAHVVADNRDPYTGPRAFRRTQLTRASDVRIPSSAKARLLQSFGANFEGQDPINDIGAWMKANGYTVVGGTAGDAGIPVLQGIAGDGFFYINCHGGRGKSQPHPEFDLYTLQSSTIVSAALDTQYQDDLANQRMTYFTAHNGETIRILGIPIGDWDTRYGITAGFVEKYWHFAADSILYVNACYSANTANTQAAAAFIMACQKQGAGVYLGWTKTLSAGIAYSSIRYFVDRLIGANQYQPESPLQRPFAWDQVLEDMQLKGLATDSATGAQLVASPAPGGPSPHILAPSIRQMFVLEDHDQLLLQGLFGPTQGKVTVGGSERPIVAWTPDTIVVDLPRTGAGSIGEVVVETQGHKSNVRRLTAWDLSLTYKYADGTGLQQNGSGQVRFRGDIGEYREKPGVVPVMPIGVVEATQASQIPVTASGTYATKDCTVTWSGTGTFVSSADVGAPNTLFAYLKVDTVAMKGAMGLMLGSSEAPFTATTTGACGNGTTPIGAMSFGMLDGYDTFALGYPAGSPGLPLPAVQFALGANYEIPGGARDVGGVHVQWSDAFAQYAPDPGAARSTKRR